MLLCLAPFAGCSKDQAQVYRVPKERQVTAQKASLPNGWEEAPIGQMRVASFQIKGSDGKSADVSVIPGVAGSDLANVNRWRGQVNLAPVQEGELAKLAQPVEIGSEKGELYDQAG